MAKCPFATWKPLAGGCGSYSGGPFRIVHHTTEGPTAEGAFSVFRQHFDPHFVIDVDGTIYQLVDTAFASCALKGGHVATNARSAIQIENVGFAAKAKDPRMLQSLAKLCRWLETTHNIPQDWPMGLPALPPKYESKRDPAIWLAKGGHYGHCHIPDNNHVDPGFTLADLTVITPNAPQVSGKYPATTPLVVAIPDEPPIIGMVPATVLELQKNLNKLSTTKPPLIPDGDFGPKCFTACVNAVNDLLALKKIK